MCKWNKWGDTRIDPCMRKFIKNLEQGCEDRYIILGCCCGHNKYPMTIIVQNMRGHIFDLISNNDIPRTRRFYKRDSDGHYYIPEVSTPPTFEFRARR